jgi:hypothetical protein
MAPLLFTCPNTKQRAPAGIEADAQSLRATWSKELKVRCPLCGEEHSIAVRKAYLDGVLDDATERLGKGLTPR